MTATERLCALLDERGVEWIDFDGEPTWMGNDRMHYARQECSCDEPTDEVTVYHLTPEQAVAATLGRGTCRNLIAHIQGQMPMLHCEECGCTTTLNVPSGGAGYIGETAMDWPLYCANCGRKVAE